MLVEGIFTNRATPGRVGHIRLGLLALFTRGLGSLGQGLRLGILLAHQFVLDAVFHYANTIAEHGEQLDQWNEDLQLGEDLQPVECLLLHLCRCLLKSNGHKVVHGFCIKAQGRHFRIEDLAEHNLQLVQFLLGHVVGDGLHPVWHHIVPNFGSDNLVWHQAYKPLKTLFQVACSRRQGLPVASNTGILRGMWQQAGDENVVVDAADVLQPVANVIHFELLNGTFHLSGS